jgi:hypothetical protein
MNPRFCCGEGNPELVRKLIAAKTVKLGQRECFAILNWQCFDNLRDVREESFPKFVINRIEGLWVFSLAGGAMQSWFRCHSNSKAGETA